jgi:DNA-binding CsgD family transcriptional regulator/PAS domain-containing protein
MQGLQANTLSDVIGNIYQCALDPVGWQPVLTRVNELMNGAYTTISLASPHFVEPRMVAHSAWDPVMLKVLNEEYGAQGVPGLLDVLYGDIDSPISTLSQMSKEVFLETPFYQNWAKPQRLLDGCVTKFVSTSDRLGAMATVTYDDREPINADERTFIRLLSPHFRRAAMISDLLNFARVQAESFKSAFDQLSTAIVLVDKYGRIVYANAQATQLFSSATYIQSIAGKLIPANDKMTNALYDCIARCSEGHEAVGSRGLGIPISGANEAAAVAYVLPLGIGTIRSSFSQAVAAVFIATALTSAPPTQDVLATLYDLTPTEAKIMLSVGQSHSPAVTASTLGVSENTVKTHLARVFSKVGVNRQSELSSLVASLSSPIQGISGDS